MKCSLVLPHLATRRRHGTTHESTVATSLWRCGLAANRSLKWQLTWSSQHKQPLNHGLEIQTTKIFHQIKVNPLWNNGNPSLSGVVTVSAHCECRYFFLNNTITPTRVQFWDPNLRTFHQITSYCVKYTRAKETLTKVVSHCFNGVALMFYTAGGRCLPTIQQEGVGRHFFLLFFFARKHLKLAQWRICLGVYETWFGFNWR